MSSKDRIVKLLSYADVKINGPRPWDIKVHNEKLYSRVLLGGNLALGEAYMDGWWDCKRIDELINKVLRTGLKNKIKSLNLALHWLTDSVLNLQSKSKAFEVGEKHYDAGNDLYKLMLAKRMVYTCGYWKNAKTLDKAQEDKLDLVCKKIGLKEGQKILDIGCGWGSFAKFAAQKYKVKVVGIKNYNDYFGMVHRCLKDDGLFLLHTIGGNSIRSIDPWFHKYIFPNYHIPSPKQIINASENLFILEDWHSFGPDYDKTLL